MRCSVCKKYFSIRKSDVHKVEINAGIIEKPKVFDSIDCTRCGCQHLLKERHPRKESETNAR